MVFSLPEAQRRSSPEWDAHRVHPETMLYDEGMRDTFFLIVSVVLLTIMSMRDG